MRQVSATARRAAGALLLAGLLLPASLPAQGEALGITSYYFSDSGGNTVSTTSFNLAKKLFRRTVMLLDLELDNVTVPPVSATTGATRPTRQRNLPFEKTRGQVIVGLEQGLTDATSVAISLYRSQEVDYVSNSAVATLTQELFQKNTTVTLKGQVIDDAVGRIEEDGSVTNSDKRTWWGVVQLAQLLSPSTVASVAYDRLHYDGFLSDPYRAVQVFDPQNVYEALPERHPDSRVRQAVTGKLTRYLNAIRGSWIAGYRYYWDDWEVDSHTADLQFNKYIVDDLILKVNYRYYTQGEAWFYRERYESATLAPDDYRTADYKLQGFDSNNFGFSLTLLFRKLARDNRDLAFLANASIEGRYFRYFNSLDFSANIYQLNLNLGI